MEAYTKTSAVINLGPAPVVPELVWSYEQRRAMSLRQCEAPVPPEVMEQRQERLRRRGSKRKASEHPGRGRRHRREVRTRQLLDFLAGRVGAYEGELPADLDGHTIHELVYAPIPDAPSWALALRMQGRELLSLAKRHGPATGWALPQPTAASEGNPKWTPYYVPRAGEASWRWWRHVVVFLARVLTALARAWWRLIPLHRQRFEGTTAEKRGGVLLASQLVEPSRCRDQVAPGVGVTPSWLRTVLGM